MTKPSVLAVITARGGSKGVPGKNIRPVCGLPLIAWTIAAARGARTVDRLILSSDDAAIIDMARRYGCEVPFVRPAELATDSATSTDVLAHAIEALEQRYDLVLLLQPTSPLRTAADIDAAVELLCATGAPGVIAVCPSEEPPYWLLCMDTEGAVSPLFPEQERPRRRQDAPPTYRPNGALYLVPTEAFLRERTLLPEGTRGWVMPMQRSVDIDTMEDIDYLEYLCSRHPEWVPKLEGQA